jgi:hypothetical protein
MLYRIFSDIIVIILYKMDFKTILNPFPEKQSTKNFYVNE